MKIKLIIISCVLFLASCKKKYICECSTVSVQQGFINKKNYTVKEKNKSAALANCSKQYEASGLATNGINCNVN